MKFSELDNNQKNSVLISLDTEGQMSRSLGIKAIFGSSILVKFRI